MQKRLSQKISKLDSLYFYFARFWQHSPIRECFDKSQTTLYLGKTGTGECFPLIHTIMEFRSGQKKFSVRKLEGIEQYPKFITIVNEAG